MCEKRSACKCRVVPVGTNDKMEVRVTKEHTQASQCQEAAVQMVKATLKQKAIEQPATLQASLIREEPQGLSGSVTAALPERHSLRRLVNRIRALVRPGNLN